MLAPPFPLSLRCLALFPLTRSLISLVHTLSLSEKKDCSVGCRPEIHESRLLLALDHFFFPSLLPHLFDLSPCRCCCWLTQTPPILACFEGPHHQPLCLARPRLTPIVRPASKPGYVSPACATSSPTSGSTVVILTHFHTRLVGACGRALAACRIPSKPRCEPHSQLFCPLPLDTSSRSAHVSILGIRTSGK